MRNWIFVKVETDQPGLVGWGEATLEWHTRAIVGALEDLATLVVGQDPRRIEHLWQMMFRQHFWHSSGIVRATAMAGEFSRFPALAKSLTTLQQQRCKFRQRGERRDKFFPIKLVRLFLQPIRRGQNCRGRLPMYPFQPPSRRADEDSHRGKGSTNG